MDIDVRNAATKPFEPTREHARLLRWAGRWEGTAKTWMDPSRPPLEAPWSCRIEAVLGGRFVRLEYCTSLEGAPLAGEMIIGFERDEMLWVTSWIDSFHTGTCVMRSTGSPGERGAPVSVRGDYFVGAGVERWGWRTELDDAREGTLVLRMFNIEPGGKEDIGVEVVLSR
jgi:hypothetical protein